MSSPITLEHLTSEDAYLDHCPTTVLKTRALSDNTCGMNPCYYLRTDGTLSVSTSVVELIKASGDFIPNDNFDPTRFFLHRHHKNAALLTRRALYAAYGAIRKSPLLSRNTDRISKLVPANAKARYVWNPHQAGYVTTETVDRRIRKLRPFEIVTANENRIDFSPHRSLSDPNRYLDLAANLLREEISDIESRFPDRKHIVLVGGKDSQLICLVPKLNPKNWYIFSAEPNFPIVRDWISENNIDIGGLFRHDGRNDESQDDFERKLICSDLYSSPVHIRYLPTLEKITQSLGSNCILWVGAMPRGASFFDGRVHERELGSRTDTDFSTRFFRYHLEQFPYWQGNITQTYANFLKQPVFCPYYMKRILNGVFAHLDPTALESRDYRSEIGERLAGKPVVWPSANPGPKAYDYARFWFNSYKYYRTTIERSLSAHRQPHMGLSTTP